jgi:DNA-directed RNA polymerase specialized sigma24 family protein
MQGTQPYTGSEQRIDVRICEKETREMVRFLSRSLPSLCRNMRRPQGEATASNDAVERALLSAYRHLGHSKGSVKMAIWLTAIALLILGPDCAETPAPAVSTKTPTQN